MNASAAQNATAVTASVRDFPSLAAATASAGKQSSALLNDSLKPQSWYSDVHWLSHDSLPLKIATGKGAYLIFRVRQLARRWGFGSVKKRGRGSQLFAIAFCGEHVISVVYCTTSKCRKTGCSLSSF